MLLEPIVIFISRFRLILSPALGIVTFFMLPARWPLPLRLLLGWDLAALYYTFVAVSTLGLESGLHRLRQIAATQDEKRWVTLFILLIASSLSLGAIGTLLTNANDMSHSTAGWHLAVAALTVVASWLLIHTMFAVHYAHAYFGDADDNPDTFTMRGGLDFPKTAEPVFSDFLYFSLVVGMTCQVSDVQVTASGMRRLTLAHGVLAFFFNTIILALSVNFAASLIS